MKRVINFITSLRLTVVCLSLALVLVFIGTLAQVNEGLYNAQNRYFRSLLIFWSPQGTDWQIPIFPGGYLIGGVLLINLLAAHAKRFELSKKKIGIFIIHAGIILLLLGQFATDLFQVESAMRLNEGETKNYSEDGRASELVLIDTNAPDADQVIAVSESHLKPGREIRDPKLPVTIRVRQYFQNSRLSNNPGAATTQVTQGAGQRLGVIAMPPALAMNERNIPAAIVELVGPQGSLGTWLVSYWLEKPQPVTVGGKTYQMAMRFARYYKPHSVQLLKFTHEKYKGTETPKNFASRVRVQHPQTGEDREVLIYMNNPLRHGGETYYQAGFDENDPRVTILQVVRNPGWLTPYFGCAIVGLGLIVQFMSHLIGFAMKRRTK